MSGYVFDPFQALPLGAISAPVGWTNVNAPFASCNIKAGTNGPGPYPPHQWVQVTSDGILTPTFPPGMGTSVANITVWFAFSVIRNGPTGVFFTIMGPPAIGTTPVPLMILVQENDLTISAYTVGTPSKLIGNTGQLSNVFVARFDQSRTNWYYVQVNAQIFHQIVMGTDFVQVTANVAIDGAAVISGTQTSNSIQVANLASLGANQIQWNGRDLGWAEPIVADLVTLGTYPRGVWTVTLTSGGSGYTNATTVTSTGGGGSQDTYQAVIDPVTHVITNILILTGGLGFTSAPAIVITDPGGGTGASATAALVPPPFIRIPQAIVEPAVEPNNSHIRIPQAVVEIAPRPTTAFIRIPQMVIELATPSPKGFGPFPEYTRRRAR